MMPLFLGAQISVSDNFNDGDFSRAPPWWGDSSLHKIENSQLRLSDSTSGQSYLALASTISKECSWYYKLKMDFNPSASNYLDLILFSDQLKLDSAFRGYYLNLGQSADEISFYRQDGFQTKLLGTSKGGLLNYNVLDLELLIARDSSHFWEVLVSVNGDSLISIFKLHDDHYKLSRASGWRPTYTKTRADRFYLDSLHIQGFAPGDSLAPRLDSLVFISISELALNFNEVIDPGFSAQIGAQFLKAIYDPDFPKQLRVEHPSVFPANDSFALEISLQDAFGNRLDSNLSLWRFEARWQDLRFNEIMADPSPPVGSVLMGFPEQEYLEILNLNSVPINLENWNLVIGDKAYPLPARELAPGKLLSFCDEDGMQLWPKHLEILPLPWSVFELPNEGEFLALISPEGQWIDSLHYHSSWLKEEAKLNGGWSLELKDPASPCPGSVNWGPSQNLQGGSPSSHNSIAQVLEDTIAPSLHHYQMPRADYLILEFDEPLELLAENFAVAHAPQFEYWLEQNQVHLFFEEVLQAGPVYQLKAKGIFDCMGNAWQDSLAFAIPSAPKAGGIFISEVLFNPRPEAHDFVEIYNSGAQWIDLSQLRIASRNTAGGSLGEPIQIAKGAQVLKPQELLVLSADSESLRKLYGLHQSTCLEVSLPSMPDEGGSLVLLNSHNETLDMVEFAEAFHSVFIGDPEGVSLNRLYWEGPAIRDYHWQSSKANENYASPGEINAKSRFRAGKWSASIPYFSPNGDAYLDEVELHYHLDQADLWLQVWIYNRWGQKVRTLEPGIHAHSIGYFTWKGEDDQGQLCESGIYTAVLNSINAEGKQNQHFLQITLSRP